MSDAPTPPADLPADVRATLEECSTAQLRDVAAYAEALADHREAAPDDGGESDGEGDDTTADAERPTGVPSKATLTVKEINGNRYYYWQWREGERIKSTYEGPVDG